MPYTLERSSSGYRVRSATKQPTICYKFKYFSKNPIAKRKAKNQLALLESIERQKRLGFVNKRSGKKSRRGSKRSGKRSSRRRYEKRTRGSRGKKSSRKRSRK